MATANANRSKLVQYLSGFQGVAAGGKASINIPTNQRVHRLILQTKAINYSGTFTTITAGGAPGGTLATFTGTVSNGVISSTIAIATAGSGMTPGTYPLIFSDTTGLGASGTYVVAAGGTVTAAPTLTSIGVPSAIDASLFFTSFTQNVNGNPIRDISPDSMMRVVQAQGTNVPLGTMYVYYTNPARNVIVDPKVTSWDLFNQGTFQLLMGISSTLTTPQLSGVIEFDYQRNFFGNPAAPTYFLQPVAQHEYNVLLPSGRSDTTSIPFPNPISRIWFLGATPNNIDTIEILADNNTMAQYTIEQLQSTYNDYGFKFGNGVTQNIVPAFVPANPAGAGSILTAPSTYPGYVDGNYNLNILPATVATGTNSSIGLQRNITTPRYFDAAYISDEDQRPENALICQNSLVIRITSRVAQNMRFVVESLPGSYR